MAAEKVAFMSPLGGDAARCIRVHMGGERNWYRLTIMEARALREELNSSLAEADDWFRRAAEAGL